MRYELMTSDDVKRQISWTLLFLYVLYTFRFGPFEDQSRYGRWMPSWEVVKL